MGQQLDASKSHDAFVPARPRVESLPPKGSCWYCDQPVDAVRRFCSPVCRHDYLEEESSYDKVEAAPLLQPVDRASE